MSYEAQALESGCWVLVLSRTHPWGLAVSLNFCVCLPIGNLGPDSSHSAGFHGPMRPRGTTRAQQPSRGRDLRTRAIPCQRPDLLFLSLLGWSRTSCFGPSKIS